MNLNDDRDKISYRSALSAKYSVNKQVNSGILNSTSSIDSTSSKRKSSNENSSERQNKKIKTDVNIL